MVEKMKLSMLKEELSSGFYHDSRLAKCQNGHLRELIDNHKEKSVTMLGGGEN
jgi:hypothetical protein